MRGRKARVDALQDYVKVFRQRRRELVPRFAVEWGLSQEKVQEYVQVLVDAGILEVAKDGMLQLVHRKSLKARHA